MTAVCFNCGKELENVTHGMPDLHGVLEYKGSGRPPLCKKCWAKIYSGITRSVK